MRIERRRVLVALWLLAALLVPLCRAEDGAASGTGRILVIYPDAADRRHGDDSVAAVARALVSLGCAADYVEAGQAGEAVEGRDHIIWCATAESERMDASLLNGYSGSLLALGSALGLEGFGIEAVSGRAGRARYRFADDYDFEASVAALAPGFVESPDYTAGSLEIGGVELPLVSARGGVRHIALADYTDVFAEAVLTRELARWLASDRSPASACPQHVVLDAVYPFTDPYRLRDIVDSLVSRRVNFVISVMPIYEHADYPAMGQFCEALRYAQANGGAVALHAPILQNGMDAGMLANRLAVANRNYLDNGVYPLALEIPSEWLFDDSLLELLGGFGTLFIRDMDAFETHAPRDYGLEAFVALDARRVFPALELETMGVSHLSCLSTAVYLNPAELSDAELAARIDAARRVPIPMTGLWSAPQRVSLNGEDALVWDLSSLTVGGERRSNTYEPRAYDGDFDYRRNIYYRFVANLQGQNRVLIAVSAVALALFILLAARSRRQMHSRFLKKKQTPEEAEGEQ